MPRCALQSRATLRQRCAGIIDGYAIRYLPLMLSVLRCYAALNILLRDDDYGDAACAMTHAYATLMARLRCHFCHTMFTPLLMLSAALRYGCCCYAAYYACRHYCCLAIGARLRCQREACRHDDGAALR